MFALMISEFGGMKEFLGLECVSIGANMDVELQLELGFEFEFELRDGN